MHTLMVLGKNFPKNTNMTRLRKHLSIFLSSTLDKRSLSNELYNPVPMGTFSDQLGRTKEVTVCFGILYNRTVRQVEPNQDQYQLKINVKPK